MKKKKEKEAAQQAAIESAPQTFLKTSGNDKNFKELSHE